MALGGSGGGGGSGLLSRARAASGGLLLALLAGLLSGGPAQARLHHLSLKVGAGTRGGPSPYLHPQLSPSAWDTPVPSSLAGWF